MCYIEHPAKRPSFLLSLSPKSPGNIYTPIPWPASFSPINLPIPPHPTLPHPTPFHCTTLHSHIVSPLLLQDLRPLPLESLLGPFAMCVHLLLLPLLVLSSNDPDRLVALAVLGELVHKFRMRLEPWRPFECRASLEVRVISLFFFFKEFIYLLACCVFFLFFPFSLQIAHWRRSSYLTYLNEVFFLRDNRVRQCRPTHNNCYATFA